MTLTQLPYLSIKKQQAVHVALRTWGWYTRLASGESLDYSTSNPLNHHVQLGTPINTPTHVKAWPSIATRIDQLIEILAKKKPTWAAAIKWHYTTPGTIREQAIALGKSKSTYHDQVRKGRQWIVRQLLVSRTLH